MTEIDPMLAKALDRYSVPPLRADFADRVLAMALAPAPAPVAPAPRRDTRGGWRRARTILIGMGAFGVVSAAAAAGGVFGDVAKDVPVIGTLIASVAPAKPKPKHVTPPAPKAKPAPTAVIAAKPTSPQPPLIADAPPIEIAPPVIERGVMRRARVERRVEAIQTRRAEKGLPPLAEPQARALAHFSMLPPEKRAEIKARVKVRLDEARAQGEVTPELRRQLIRQELRAMRAETRAQKQNVPNRDPETPSPAAPSLER
ncbi:MAG: hypothetical protein ACKVOJ_10630 [Sphingomonadaceae bacterium]